MTDAFSFIESEVPDITESIPAHISARTSAPIFVSRGALVDISIGDLPFWFAISDQNPYVRETADFRRQQIDTSKEPGEQTLAQWWVRDQDSWHRGAGIKYYEPGSNADTQYRYDASVGVDVWTQGQATLLHGCALSEAATGSQNVFCTGAVVGGVDVYFGVINGTLFRHDGTTRTNYSGAADFTPAVAGSKVLVGSSDRIRVGSTSGSTLTDLWTGAAAAIKPYWVKSRIIASSANLLYDLTLTGGVLPGTPLYTHPDANWTWTGVTEAPGAILASGYSNGYGYIYRFTLEDPGGGGTPTLGAAIQVADFPPGEEVYSIKSYLSTYIAIGTSNGVRIGVMDTDGSLQYGPLVIETTQPVRALTARSSFIYAGIQDDIEGNSGAARIDLGSAITDLRYAWAYDAQAHTTGIVQGISFIGNTDRVVMGVQGKGSYLQSATLYEQSGYIKSGRIRYGTAEPKSFNRAKIRADIPADTSINLTTYGADGSSESIVNLGGAWNTDEDITLKTIADFGQAYASIKLTLIANETTTATPVLDSFQVKATPIPRIQRMIKIPLRLNDVEEDRNGVKSGRTGSAILRLQALEQFEQDHSVVVIQDYTTGESYSAQVRSVSFVRDTPPSRNRNNFGGIVTVTVLKL
jgi:hypothetical protein